MKMITITFYLLTQRDALNEIDSWVRSTNPRITIIRVGLGWDSRSAVRCGVKDRPRRLHRVPIIDHRCKRSDSVLIKPRVVVKVQKQHRCSPHPTIGEAHRPRDVAQNDGVVGDRRVSVNMIER